MTGLFLKLAGMSISASYLILAALLLRPVLKKAPRWSCCVLWGLVALRLLCPMALESTVSLSPDPQAVSQGLAPLVMMPVELPAAAAPAPAAAPPVDWGSIAAAVWLVGMGVLLGYGAVSYLRLRFLVREAVTQDGQVYLCDQAPSPFILGIVWPRIYLPSGLGENQRRYVLAHENAHIQRRDHWWKPLGFVLLAVYWFNPLIWLAYVLLCRDIELACDERVIGSMGLADKKAYATALLNGSAHRRYLTACPLAFGEVSVKNRVKNVLRFKKPGFWILAGTLAVCVGAAVFFLTDPALPEADLSLLNYRNLAPIAREQAAVSACAAGEELTISGERLADFLAGAQWEETGAPASPLWSPEVTISLYDFLELRFYKEAPGLVRIVYGEISRYYDMGGDYGPEITALLTAAGTPPEPTQPDQPVLPEPGPELRKLTLADVVALSQKGMDLSVLDFFAFAEVCGVPFGYCYVINPLFSLYVGSSQQDGTVDYAYLRVEDGSEDRVDIRYEDVPAFLAKYRSRLLDLEITALLEKAVGEYFSGDLVVECHEVLGSAESRPDSEGNVLVTLYMQAAFHSFRHRDGTINGSDGYYFPLVMTWKVDPAGSCTLVESWQGRDWLDREISDHFPPELAQKVMGDDCHTYLITQNTVKAQAILDMRLSADPFTPP